MPFKKSYHAAKAKEVLTMLSSIKWTRVEVVISTYGVIKGVTIATPRNQGMCQKPQKPVGIPSSCVWKATQITSLNILQGRFKESKMLLVCCREPVKGFKTSRSLVTRDRMVKRSVFTFAGCNDPVTSIIWQVPFGLLICFPSYFQRLQKYRDQLSAHWCILEVHCRPLERNQLHFTNVYAEWIIWLLFCEGFRLSLQGANAE